MASQNTLHVTIASVGETLFDGAAASVSLPGSTGMFEVLPHHEPLVSTLREGVVAIMLADGEKRTFPIEGGVAEISDNRAVVLL